MLYADGLDGMKGYRTPTGTERAAVDEVVIVNGPLTGIHNTFENARSTRKAVPKGFVNDPNPENISENALMS